MKLMNDFITLLIDQNLFYSRLSFFESDREAINIKFIKSQKQFVKEDKFCIRSSMNRQLIPNPSDGKVRAFFKTD